MKTLAGLYEIREVIGSGGGGTVYLGWHLRLQKKVVLKEHKHGFVETSQKSRREADALKALSHTYIPQVYDFITTDDGMVYTVMDYIEGESLDKPLARGERFSYVQIKKWTHQLLEAIVYLHNQPPHGILHSDIKPANIMLKSTGDICLIDFNIALALDQEGAVAVGASHGYASPEHYGPQSLAEATGRKYTEETPVTVADSSDKTAVSFGTKTTVLMPASKSSPAHTKKLLDVRSDIYSLGATVYHLLCGVKPAPKANEVLALSRGAYNPLFVDIIEKAMRPDPSKRYQSAAQMLEDLDTMDQRDPKRLRKKRLVRGGIAACIALMALGSTALYTFQGRSNAVQAAHLNAQASLATLAEGNKPKAISLALDAVPKQDGLQGVPVPAITEKALSAALGVYDLTNGYSAHLTVSLPSKPLFVRISPEGDWTAVVYTNKVAVINNDTGTIAFTKEAAKTALPEAIFASEDVLLYAGSQGLTALRTDSGEIVWQGNLCTKIALSADGTRVAAVDKAANQAFLYGIHGNNKITVDFGNRHMRVTENPIAANTQQSIFALNQDGTQLAVSFADGSLSVFNTADGTERIIFPAGNATQFFGGFYKQYLGFSAYPVNDQWIFSVSDTHTQTQTGGFQSSSPIGVFTAKEGMFLSLEDTVVKINPETGAQTEAAFAADGIGCFHHHMGVTAVLTKTNEAVLYGASGKILGWTRLQDPADFIASAGEYAVVAGRNKEQLRILVQYSPKEGAFAYEGDYFHNEARVLEEAGRLLLYSYKGLRIYDFSGTLIQEVILPQPEMVRDQQYNEKSQRLAVLYPDALLVYDAINGNVLLEYEQLRSVFFTDYGISLYHEDGKLELLDMTTLQTSAHGIGNGTFAAWCGMVVDDTFLKGRTLLGAAKTNDGFLFAVGTDEAAVVYNQQGKSLFEFQSAPNSLVYFLDKAMIFAPLHQQALVLELPSGKQTAALDSTDFLTDVVPDHEGLLLEYMTAKGVRYGTRLNEAWEVTSELPSLCHISQEKYYFDNGNGFVRWAQKYTLDQLISLAKNAVLK